MALIGAVSPLLILLAAQGAAPCALAVQPQVEAASFSAAGHRPRTDLAEEVRARLGQAVAEACRQGWLRGQDLAAYDTLLIQNGEGATEPIVYFDHERGWRTLVFQYAFQSGGAPESARIVPALRCWKEPEREECFAG